MSKKNWEMFFEVETSNPVWFFGHYNSLYNQCKFEELERTYYSIYASELKPFKATIKFSYFDKSYAIFDDVNIKNRFYIVYLTDLKDFMTHRIVIPYDSITRFSDSLFKNNFSTFNLINNKSRVQKQTLLLHEYIR